MADLVDLGPSGFYPGHIEQDRAVLPERPLLDVVDEADGAKVHVAATLALNSRSFRDIAGIRRGRK